MHRLIALSLVVLALAAPTAALASGSAYVTNLNGRKVSQYAIGAGGLLGPLSPPTVDTPGDGPIGVALSPDGRSAYVSLGEFCGSHCVNGIAQYDVDPRSGALSPKTPGIVGVGMLAAAIAVTPDGKSAYVDTSFGFGHAMISQFDIDPLSGTLSPKTPATVAGPGNRIIVSPDGKSAYATNGAHFGGAVAQYDIDPQSGTLSPKSPPTVAAGSQAAGVAISPNSTSVYVANDFDDTISQYDVDPLSGKLSPKSPPTVAAGLRPGSIAVSPDGKSAYVANVVGNTTSQYDVDPLSGKLSPKNPATVATGSGPLSIVVTPDGKSVYAANNFDDTVSQYDVDPLSGRLSPKNPASVAAGSAPEFVAVTPPRVPTSKEQCKHGGWHDFPRFKNQGRCVAFVAHGK